MRESYARLWWPFILRGSFAILFGLAALLLPGITLEVLVLLVGAFFFADGVLAIVAAASTRRVESRWWVALLEGLAGVAIGILAVFRPGATLVAIVLLIAAWALITGVLEVAAAVRLRKVIQGEWFLALGGVLSILFGLLLAAGPGIGAVALVWFLGFYALLFGALLIFLGFRLRSLSGV